MELTKSDQKLLKRMERSEKMKIARYTVIGLALGIAIFSFTKVRHFKNIK